MAVEVNNRVKIAQDAIVNELMAEVVLLNTITAFQNIFLNQVASLTDIVNPFLNPPNPIKLAGFESILMKKDLPVLDPQKNIIPAIGEILPIPPQRP